MKFKSNIMRVADKIVGPAVCAVFSRAQKRIEYRRIDTDTRRVLVIRPGGIGDAVMLLPALVSVQNMFPNIVFDFLCESRNSEIMRLAFPHFVTMEFDTSPISVIKRLLERGRYCAVVDTEQFHNFSAVMCAMTRAPLRVGFKINTNRRGLYTHLVGYDPDAPEDRQFCRLFESAVGKEIKLPHKKNILCDALAGLPDAPSRPGSSYVLLHVGGSIPGKRWASENYAKVCDKLPENMDIVLTGSKEDCPGAAEIIKHSHRRITNLCGRLPLRQTAALCRDADLLIGPDSGIAHLAAAAGTRCVVLFGPSDPDKWGPPEECGEAVRKKLPCSPCSIFGLTKPCSDCVCIKSITPDEVAEAVKRQLDLCRNE